MDPQSPRSPPGAEPAFATLGDVIYADLSGPRGAEAEWVALVRCIGEGDQRALQALYDRTHKIVFTLSLRITSNRETAEEITLDVFHEAWRRAASYDPVNGTVIGWILNLARSRAIDRQRYERRSKRVHVDANVASASQAELGPQERNQSLDDGRALRAALTQLNADERRAIEVAYFSGLSYAETAAQLGQPLGTVKTRIRSGLQKLRRALAGRGRES